jgi:GNAT superfamily N-acetyltransferase
MNPDSLTYSVHDAPSPADAVVIDTGIGDFNAAAAPLSGVVALMCVARSGADDVVGGAVGRTWGECCELQQLWVAPVLRRTGIGSRLIRLFEDRAIDRGCLVFYLETFTFQAPDFYREHGYASELAIEGFPGGIVKHHMFKRLGARVA